MNESFSNTTHVAYSRLFELQKRYYIRCRWVFHIPLPSLLLAAKQALQDVIDNNDKLFDDLNVERFFYCVRPYYKPHRVGLHEYRGANAGDFAGINVIDLLLGLCRADDPYYSQLLVD